MTGWKLVRRKVGRDGQDVRRTGDAMYDGDRFSPVQLPACHYKAARLEAYPTFDRLEANFTFDRLEAYPTLEAYLTFDTESLFQWSLAERRQSVPDMMGLPHLFNEPQQQHVPNDPHSAQSVPTFQ